MNRERLVKICIFSQSIEAGGAEKQSILLAIELNKNYDVTYLFFYNDKYKKENLELLNKNNIKYFTPNGSFIKKIIKTIIFFKKNKPLILFNYLLFPNMFGGLLAKIMGIKYSIGGIRNSKFNSRKLFFNKLAYNYLNYFSIVNNYSGYNFLIKNGFKESKGLVIPNFVNIEKSKLRTANNPPIILSIGRFVKQKNYKLALKLISVLKKRNVKFKYKIVGWGEEFPIIKQMISELDLKNEVELFNNVNDIDKFYKESDIYLQTSIFEGMSNTVMEAMSFSLPLVVSDAGDNSYLCKENINGYLCDIDNEEKFCNSLEFLISDTELRIEFGEKSRKIVQKEYSKKQFVKNYTNFIENLN